MFHLAAVGIEFQTFPTSGPPANYYITGVNAQWSLLLTPVMSQPNDRTGVCQPPRRLCISDTPQIMTSPKHNNSIIN